MFLFNTSPYVLILKSQQIEYLENTKWFTLTEGCKKRSEMSYCTFDKVISIVTELQLFCFSVHAQTLFCKIECLISLYRCLLQMQEMLDFSQSGFLLKK